MFGLSTTEIFILILLIIVGGEKAIKLLAIIPGFAPLAQAIEKLTKNGNGKNGDKGIDEILKKHEERLDIANDEMGDVKVSLARIDERTEAMQSDIKETKVAINNIYKKIDEKLRA